MKLESLINALKNEFRASNNVFYEKIWEERIGAFLPLDNKFESLIKWVDAEIERLGETLNVFAPITKLTVGLAGAYTDILKDIAVLIHCRELLLEPKLTEEERANIEYFICKLFYIHYNEKLGEYV